MGNRIRGCKVYVYRFNNSSASNAREAKNAKPCLLCQHELREAGVTKVTYIDDFDKIQVLKSRDMATLIGNPATITSMFLTKVSMDSTKRFCPNEYILQGQS